VAVDSVYWMTYPETASPGAFVHVSWIDSPSATAEKPDGGVAKVAAETARETGEQPEVLHTCSCRECQEPEASEVSVALRAEPDVVAASDPLR
jgi:hypothetical protein